MHDQAAYIYPADLQKAKKHGLATRIFKGSLQQLCQGDRCQCCNRYVGVQSKISNAPIDYDYSPTQVLTFLGPGVPLLFSFIQNAATILITFFIIYGGYAMISNWYSCDCGDDSFQSRITRYSSVNQLANIKQRNTASILATIYLPIYFIVNQFLIKRIRQKNVQFDQVVNTPSDYSLIVTHLPEDIAEQQIRQMVEEYSSNLSEEQKEQTNNLCIEKIILSYGLQELIKVKQKELKQYLQAKIKDPDTPIPRDKIQVQLKTASFAIIIFKHKFSKQLFLKQDQGALQNYCYSPLKLSIRGKPVGVAGAPQPDDIIWQNADVNKSRMVLNIIISYTIGITLLFGGGYLQYFLQVIQHQIQNSTNKQIFSFASSLAMTIVNMIILQFLRFITKLEGQKTKTTQNRSLLVKFCLYSFFNCGVFSTVAYVLAISLSNFEINGSFANQIFYFMALNAFLTNILNLVLNQLEFPNCIIRKLLPYFPTTQRKANILYQLTEPDFPIQYGYVIQTIWLTCFYSLLVPLSVLYSIVGLYIFYKTQAQLFRTSYRVPNMLSFDLTKMACRLLDYSGLFLSIGHSLILLYLHFTVKVDLTTVQITSITLSFIFSIFLIIFPSYKFNKRMFKLTDRKQESKQYSQSLSEFQVTYEQTYPLFDSSHNKREQLIPYLNFARLSQQNNEKANQILQISTKRQSLLQNQKEVYVNQGINNTNL